ncbi:MAG: glutamine-hydrolyzing carbamoyl-phosphate synthase small subunit [Bacteroidetes bacterium]|nr:glutamine-hydrolyzing carbamoyl-phosphate synthase small subunit [Bacteroidota bacterium]
MPQSAPAVLMLSDGTVFHGLACGKTGTTTGEICFNTGMTGYQEIFSDPSYSGQIVTMTHTHIGNYGVVEDEMESSRLQIAGMVVKNFSEVYSRSAGKESLQQLLERNQVVGITGVETRALVRHIRSKGAMNAVISSEITDLAQLKQILAEVPGMEGRELSSQVCTQEVYQLGESSAPYKVAVVDYGVKRNILRNLVSRGCYLTVYPARTTAETILAANPDGIFLSNGPGDPAAMPYAVDAAKTLLTSGKPLFGICLGHQLLAQACGARTAKMPFGHRGVNHPIKNLLTGKCEITSQNHGFVVTEESLAQCPELELTHRHLNDHSIAGIRHRSLPAFSVQYHPESSPGPHDSRYLFDQFIGLMAKA